MRLRRAPLIAVAAIALAGDAGAAGTPASTPQPPAPGSAAAMLGACHRDPAQAFRSATFSAQMAAVKGTKQMGVLFVLEHATPQQPSFVRVTFPAGQTQGFETWQNSAPGVTVFGYSQNVYGLAAPAAYRVLVRYRWLNARHHVIRREHRLTPACRMPDERPNLVPGAVMREAGGAPGTVVYRVIVRNDGLGPAGPFQVALTVDGTPVLPNQAVSGLASATRQAVTFTGPRCSPGGTLTVTVDAAAQVDETNEADNTKTLAC